MSAGIINNFIANIITSYAGLWGLVIICMTTLLSGILLILQKPYIAHTILSIKNFIYKPGRSIKIPILPVLSFNAPASPLIIKTPAFESEINKPEFKLEIKPEIKSEIKENIKEEIKEEIKPDIKNEIAIIERDRDMSLSALKKAEDETGATKQFSFTLPPLKLLDYDAPSVTPVDPSQLKSQAEKLQRAFLQFGIEGTIREIRPGPVVTNFEFVPAPGIKLSRISALADDIAMAMFAVQVRIVTPIPGKGAVGIEVPNARRETVYLKEIVADQKYRNDPHVLSMAIGKDVEGVPFFMNLADMPHVLIAGTTGSGKSVSVNAMIGSILYRATPQDVRFLMIDPKMLELSIYNGIPHLLLPPIIDSKKAANALRWAVKEMDQRYSLMKEAGVRDISTYNQRIKQNPEELTAIDNRPHEHMPYIVIVVDEYADLLAIAGKEVEGYIMRLAQKARACGIHVMLATQRPSVDVITGVIKANFPVRMGFRLASMHDSKTIINKTGAEKLLGRGDLLIMPPGSSDLFRIHGAFVSEKELSRVVNFWQQQKPPEYRDEIADFEEEDSLNNSGESSERLGQDEKFDEALAIVRQYNKCSTSFLQRQLAIGYNRAARIVEHMEKTGLVGPVLNARGEREIF
jgi:S-DNA-T family DNA segregation ATPase FtsK/SpoIIIE